MSISSQKSLSVPGWFTPSPPVQLKCQSWWILIAPHRHAADMLGWLQHSQPVPPNLVAWIRRVFPFSWEDTNLQVHKHPTIALGTIHPHHQRAQQLSITAILFCIAISDGKSVDRMNIWLLPDCKRSIWQGSLKRTSFFGVTIFYVFRFLLGLCSLLILEHQVGLILQ